MANYESTPNKRVYCNKKVILFSAKGEYETEDKSEVEALSKAKDVKKVDGRSKKKAESEGEKE